MIYYPVQLGTGNWNSADLPLNCGRDSFSVEKQKQIISNEKGQQILEMYSAHHVITTPSAQTAAICHKLWLLLAALHSNM